jgi:hypothetical protein
MAAVGIARYLAGQNAGQCGRALAAAASEISRIAAP